MPIGSTFVFNPGDLILHTVSSSGNAFQEVKIAAATSSLILFNSNGVLSSQSLNSTTIGTASYASGSFSGSHFGTSSYATSTDTASYLVPTNSYSVTNLTASGNISASNLIKTSIITSSNSMWVGGYTSDGYTTTPSITMVAGTTSSGTQFAVNLTNNSNGVISLGAQTTSGQIKSVAGGPFFVGATGGANDTILGFSGSSSGGGTYVNFSQNGARNGFHVTFNSGADLLNVNTSGNVGINVATASNIAAKLHVSGSAANETEFLIQNTSGTNLMFVSSSGNIGIGTNNPIVPLDIATNPATTGLRLAYANGQQLNVTAGSSGTGLYQSGSGYLALGVNSNGSLGNPTGDIIRITNTGLVGIGTTSPNTRLEVNGTFRAGNGVDTYITYDSAADNLNFRKGSYNITFGFDDSNSFAPTIGITGTSSPLITPSLYAKASASAALLTGIKLENANSTINTSSISLNFRAGGNVEKGLIAFQQRTVWGVGDMVFALNNTADNSTPTLADAKMVLLGSNGNIGIGSTAPTNKLDVVGNISCSFITASNFIGTASIATNALTASYLTTANNYQITNLTASAISASNTGSFGALQVNGVINQTQTSSDLNLSINSAGRYSTILWNNNNTIKGQLFWDQTNDGFILGTTSASSYVGLSAGNSGTGQHIRISASGNVGIGLTNPNKLFSVGPSNAFTVDTSGNTTVGQLNVQSSTPSQLIFGNYQNSGTTRPEFIFNGPSAWMGLGQLTASSVNHLRLGTVTNVATNWGTFGTTPFNLMIDGGLSVGTTGSLNNGLLVSGSVGIGTTSPVNSLDVVGNISCSVITASLISASVSGSHFGTSSWATNTLTASYLVPANSYQVANFTGSGTASIGSLVVGSTMVITPQQITTTTVTNTNTINVSKTGGTGTLVNLSQTNTGQAVTGISFVGSDSNTNLVNSTTYGMYSSINSGLDTFANYAGYFSSAQTRPTAGTNGGTPYGIYAIATTTGSAPTGYSAYFAAGDANTIPLTLKGANGQTASLMQVLNSSGAPLFTINASGSVSSSATGSFKAVGINTTNINTAALTINSPTGMSGILVNSTSINRAPAAVVIAPTNSSNPALVIQGLPTQSSNLMYVETSAGSQVFAVSTASGVMNGAWTMGGGASLTISTGAGGNDLLRLSNVAASGKVYYLGSQNNGSFVIRDATLSVDRLIIDQSGSVGIGTTPVNMLDVEGAVVIGSTYAGTNTAPANGLLVQGSVGIGLINTVNKLDVAGNISASVVTASLYGTSSWTNALNPALTYSANTLNSTASNVAVLNVSNYIAGNLTGSVFGTSSWALTASVGLSCQTASYLPVSTYFITSSWASNALTASALVPTNNYQISNLTASGFISASGDVIARAFSGSFSGSITNAITASYALAFSGSIVNAISASYALSASYAPGGSGLSGGTTNYIPLWTSPTGQASSIISQSNNIISISGSLYVSQSITSSNISASSSGSFGIVGIGTSIPSALLELSSSTISTLINVKGAGGLNILNVSGSGNIGIGTAANAVYKMQISGSFSATTKSFDIKHPKIPNKRLIYGSLESPYHGIRLTGKGKLVRGKAIVSLPDYINALVDFNTVNIQITNIKHDRVIYIDTIDEATNTFTVAANISKNKLKQDLEFYWTFTAVRKDVPELQVEV